jgi:hypothetical protein
MSRGGSALPSRPPASKPARRHRVRSLSASVREECHLRPGPIALTRGHSAREGELVVGTGAQQRLDFLKIEEAVGGVERGLAVVCSDIATAIELSWRREARE